MEKVPWSTLTPQERLQRFVSHGDYWTFADFRADIERALKAYAHAMTMDEIDDAVYCRGCGCFKSKAVPCAICAFTKVP